MIDGSEKRNHQLAFELQNLHVREKRSNYFTPNILFLIGLSPLANSSKPAYIDQGPICTSEKLFVCHHQCFKNADGLPRFYKFCPRRDNLKRQHNQNLSRVKLLDKIT